MVSGFYFVLEDLQTWIPWYSTHWIIQSTQGSFAFILSLLLISLVWGLRCLRSEYRIISSDFFFLEKLPFPGAMKYIFFHLPWFISEKLGLGCLLEEKVSLFRSEVANLTKTLRAPHGNVSSETAVCVEMPNTALKTSSKSQNYTDMTLSTCWVVELREKLWKQSQGRIREDNPLGGLL